VARNDKRGDDRPAKWFVMPGSTRHPANGCHAGLDRASRQELVMPGSIRHPGLPALTVKARNDKRTQDFLDCGSSPQ
jgi:hypothetical protein